MAEDSSSGEVIVVVQTFADLRVAVCAVDVDRHSVFLSEFLDNTFFFNFEAFLLQLADGFTKLEVHHCTHKSDKNDTKIPEVIKGLEIAYHQADGSKVSVLGAEKSLMEAVVKPECKAQLSVTRFENALDLAAFAFSNIASLNTFIGENRFDLKTADLSRFMRLDANVVKALDLVPVGNQKGQSVLEAIDRTKTKMGRRCLRRWLLQPLASRDDLEERQTSVSFLVDNNQFREFVQNSFLKNIPDLATIATKFYRIHAGLRTGGGLSDVVRVYQVIKNLMVLKTFFDGFTVEAGDKQAISSTILEPVDVCLQAFEKYLEFTEKYIDLDKQKKSGEVMVKPAISTELDELAKELAKIEKEVEKERKQAEEDLGYPVSLEKNKVGGYLFVVNKKAEKVISDDSNFKKKYKVASVRANYMRLTTDKLKKLGEDSVYTADKYSEAQSGTVGKVLKIAATYHPAMEELGEVIGQIDALCSLSQFSIATLDNPRSKPVFNEGQRISLRNCRHPALEKYGEHPAVANDCVMEHGKSSFQVITGPNMGGKSTYLRQTAINLILAQTGSFVCAEAASLPLFDSIVSRVGAGDIQSRGVSTWMAELLEVSCMLSVSSPKAFLLIDELGRGTSTSEGIGMTWAIAEHIIQKLDCYCLFATHFFELTKLADQFPSVQNMHVDGEIKDGKLELNYRILTGPADKSYGIHILELLKFPQPVIMKAAEIQQTTKLSDLKSKLEEPEKMKEENPNETENDPSFETKVAILKAFKAAQTSAKAGTFTLSLREQMAAMLC